MEPTGPTGAAGAGPTTVTPTETGRLPVRLRAWGATEADVDRAISEAGKGWGRQRWAFTSIDRLTGATNPLPKYEPSMIAADAGSGWAYVTFRADR